MYVVLYIENESLFIPSSVFGHTTGCFLCQGEVVLGVGGHPEPRNGRVPRPVSATQEAGTPRGRSYKVQGPLSQAAAGPRLPTSNDGAVVSQVLMLKKLRNGKQ